MGPGISIWRAEFLTPGRGYALRKLTCCVHKAQGGLSRGLFLNLIFQKKLCVPFWLLKGIWLPMFSQNQLPIVFSPCLSPTLIEVFPAAFMKPEKFTMSFKLCTEFGKIGWRSTEWQEALPPTKPEPPLAFLKGEGSCVYLGIFFFFPLKTLELSSQKIASAQGTAGQECSHWV